MSSSRSASSVPTTLRSARVRARAIRKTRIGVAGARGKMLLPM
jgi:hypothetical protein